MSQDRPGQRIALPARQVISQAAGWLLLGYWLKLLSKEAPEPDRPYQKSAPAKNASASSPFERLLRLGGLIGRIGASVAIERLLSRVLPGPSRQNHQLANLGRNAERIVNDLSELQGATMQVGRTLSLQDALSPRGTFPSQFGPGAQNLHTPPILPPHLEQRIGDLPERGAAHRVHQHFEHVLIGDHRLLQAQEHGAGLVLVPRLEFAQAL